MQSNDVISAVLNFIVGLSTPPYGDYRPQPAPLEHMHACGVTVYAKAKSLDFRGTSPQEMCAVVRAVELATDVSLTDTAVYISSMEWQSVSRMPKLASMWQDWGLSDGLMQYFYGMSYEQGVVHVVPARTFAETEGLEGRTALSWRMALTTAHEMIHEVYRREGMPTDEQRHHCEMMFGRQTYRTVVTLMAPTFGMDVHDVNWAVMEAQIPYQYDCHPG